MSVRKFVAVLILSACTILQGAVVYVDSASQTPAAPYATEATAASTLADAATQADVLAQSGDECVVVSVKSGEYNLEGEIGVGYGIRYVSESGPDSTVINQTLRNCRAFCVTNGIVSGFTIRGVGCDDTGPVNSAAADTENGFAVLIRNSNGGTAMVTNCVIEGFVSSRTAASNPTLYGGTVNIRGSSSYLLDSIVRNNSTAGRGGGIYLNKDATVSGCVITNNAAKEGGGGVACYESGSLRNCLVAFNSSQNACAGVHGNYWTGSNRLIENCTIVFNACTKADVASGLLKGNTLSCPVINTIIYYNTSAGTVGRQCEVNQNKNTSFDHCILGDEPDNASEIIDCIIGTPPVFVNSESGDFRLAEGSPGIDSGRAMSKPLDTDVGGRMRVVDGLENGTVAPDIGCFEYDRRLDGTYLSVDRASRKYVTSGSSASYAATFSYAGDVLEDAEYVWDFGDGTVVRTSDSEVAHTYVSKGTYPLSVTATAGGHTGKIRIEQSVFVFPSDESVVWVTPNGEHDSDSDSPAAAVVAAKELIAKGVSSVMIAVAPGKYVMDETLLLDKAITLCGVEGPEKTCFTASSDKGVSLVKLSHAKAVLSGVTLADSKNTYHQSVVALNIMNGLATNCVIRGIESFWSWQTPPHGCALTMSGGKAVEVTVRDNCSKDSASSSWYKNGAPVKLYGTALMDRCRILGNACGLPYEAWINNKRNRNDELAGGGVYLSSGSPVCRNTLIAGNRTVSQPGAGAYVVAGTLENCTVVGNSMTASTNEVWSSGIYVWPGAKVVNCISDANMNGANSINAGGEDDVDLASAYTYSCLPGFIHGGVGCTTANPRLDADYVSANAESVLGKGKNLEWMENASDLAGAPRRQGFRVDMGCYETDSRIFGFTLKIR